MDPFNPGDDCEAKFLARSPLLALEDLLLHERDRMAPSCRFLRNDCYSDRGSQLRSKKFEMTLPNNRRPRSMGRVASAGSVEMVTESLRMAQWQ